MIIKKRFLELQQNWDTIIIETPAQFDKLYQEVVFCHDAIIFRGQPCSNWALKSTLFRLYEKIMKNTNINIKNFLWMAEQHFIQIMNRLNEHNANLHTLAEAQHLGTPTPLIDFTSSFENALWFALQPNFKICHPKDNNDKIETKSTCNACVFLIAKDVGMRTKMNNISSDSNVIYKCPISINSKRGVSQRSFFIIHNQSDMIKSYNIIKIEIKNSKLLKNYIQQFLFKSGIDHESIFPDLKGVFDSYIDEYYEYNMCVLKGNAFNEKKIYEKAIEQYKKATQLKPNIAYAYFKWGGSLNKLNSKLRDPELYWQAIKKCKIATKLNPKYAEAYNNWGFSLYSLGLYEKSIKFYEKSIKLNSYHIDVYYNLGNSLDKLNKFSEAIKNYLKVSKLNSNYENIYCDLGNATINYAIQTKDIDQLQKATKYYKKAIELNPKNHKAYFGYGIVLISLNENYEAILKLKKAIELNPDYKNILNKKNLQMLDKDYFDLY